MFSFGKEHHFPERANKQLVTDTISLSKDNAAARRSRRRRITNTSRTPTTKPTKLAKESEMV